MSDTLAALSGLADAFQRILDDKYIAGIWMNDIVRGLFWVSRYRQHNAYPPLSHYLSASHTWTIRLPHLPNTQVLEASVTPATSDPLRSIKAEYLRLSRGLYCNQQTNSRQCKEGSHVGDPFELYGDLNIGDVGKQTCEGTFFFVLSYYTKEPVSIRGLIIEPTERVLDEYRRVDAFDFRLEDRAEFIGFNCNNLNRKIITLV
ncbi:hypothetical protein CC86DRAFT_409861 [Ophiobolus disseminans]|uniref:Heterokaryon incompatibility domain-containing protein n=1 Tax=Ophiobolus disseminans TaxID=1469910 RepID=A0A6A6ZRL6_9PLEO|nr:hypothetical protein CC86DRAFT_409861 [Ophiobolus disseminans]